MRLGARGGEASASRFSSVTLAAGAARSSRMATACTASGAAGMTETTEFNACGNERQAQSGADCCEVEGALGLTGVVRQHAWSARIPAAVFAIGNIIQAQCADSTGNNTASARATSWMTNDRRFTANLRLGWCTRVEPVSAYSGSRVTGRMQLQLIGTQVFAPA